MCCDAVHSSSVFLFVSAAAADHGGYDAVDHGLIVPSDLEAGRGGLRC